MKGHQLKWRSEESTLMPASNPLHSQSLTDKKFDAQRLVPDISPFCLHLTDLKRADYWCDLNKVELPLTVEEMWLSIINPLIKCTYQLLLTYHLYKRSLSPGWQRRLIWTRVIGLKWHGNLAHSHVSAELHHQQCVGTKNKMEMGIKGIKRFVLFFLLLGPLVFYKQS